MSVLIETDRRLDLAPSVNRRATDVTKQGVEGATRQFASVLHIKIGVVVLDVCKAVPPFRLLNATEFLALDLGDYAGGLVWVLLSRRKFGKRRLHRLH